MQTAHSAAGLPTASSGAIDLGKENPFHPDELNSDGFHNSQIKPSVQFINI
jgi:hypothetical protein